MLDKLAACQAGLTEIAIKKVHCLPMNVGFAGFAAALLAAKAAGFILALLKSTVA